MKIEPLSNLRTRLRFDTRPAHEALDHFVSTFDLATPEGLSAFLSMQLAALDVLMALGCGVRSRAIMPDLAARASADLTTLGATPSPVAPDWTKTPDPLAVDYVLLGSRLGTAVLRKRWQTASDPRVTAANAYFGAPSYIDQWQAFCTDCADLPADSAQSDRVISDTSRLFDFYLRCAHAAQTDLTTAHA